MSSKVGEEQTSIAGSAMALTTTKLIEKETERYLASKEIPVGEPVMAARKGKGLEGDVELTTNIYPLVIEGQLRVYRYDVRVLGIKIRGDQTRKVELTKKFKDDFTQTERRFRTRDVIVSFMNKHKDFASASGCMYNDLQSIMYTLRPMAPSQGTLEFKFDPATLHNADEFKRYKLDSVNLSFNPTEEWEMNLGDVRDQRNLLYANRELAQFLDIATSQEVFFREGEHVHFSTSNSYMFNPEAFGFTAGDTIVFEDTLTYLGIGCQKAIHTVEGAPGQPQIGGMQAIVIQPKKTPFHSDDLLTTKVDAMLQSACGRGSIDQKVNYLEKMLKGLMVYTTHNQKNIQFLIIKGFARENASEKEVTIGGDSMTVSTYFKKKYGISLSRTDLPLVITSSLGKDGKTQKNYYPIEVLRVADNQRVKTQQLTPSMTQATIKKCAIPPAILRVQMEKVANSLHLWDSEYLRKAKIRVLDNPLQLYASGLNHPEIGTADGRPMAPYADSAAWKMNRVLSPQVVVGAQYGWAAFVFSMGRDTRGVLSQNEMDDFLDRYQNQANNRGIRLNQPRKKEVVTLRNLEEMATYFDWASKNDLAFLFCFHPDSDDQMHHEIKANERRFFVITQCMKMGTVRNVLSKGQRLTIDNVLNKSNVKLGGLNYTLPKSRIANDAGTLIIGISSNHPGGGFGGSAGDEASSDANKAPSFVLGPPTAVGFAANVGPTKTPYDFVGDFVYQQSQREEKVNVIEAIMQRCFHYFRATRDGALPNRVILFRNGCSEGQFSSILKYEVPLLRKALQDEGMTRPVLTLVVCNKLQNVRFFHKKINPGLKPPEQNLKPGTVIDNSAVHPEYAEFFLNSHRALQGTARTPKYTVVYDDFGFDMQELERITYDLCFGHQIISMPVSLPSPVYIASEYAKRGRNLFNSLYDDLKRKNPDVKYTDLNEAISYYANTGAECWIGEYRVNA